MANAFKDLYNREFITTLLNHLSTLREDLDRELFVSSLFSKEWDNLELKERMRSITIHLHTLLGSDYSKNIETITELIPLLQESGYSNGGLEFIFLPDDVEIYGLDYWDLSIAALEKITTFISCEFAVRPFIKKYGQEMIDQMLLWADSDDPWVRRLATEGCRPRLPWGMALPTLKVDPSPIIPILEKLKDDESLDVRRSVANNLNDISKDNPETVIVLIKKWKGRNRNLDWLCKHASRTLLKAGVEEMLAIWGYADPNTFILKDFRLVADSVKLGGNLEFLFSLTNRSEKEQLLRLEYKVYFLKSNGKQSPKIFKISERIIPGGQTIEFSRKQHFKEVTTRKLYCGEHRVALVINGREEGYKTFFLEE